MNEPLNRSLVVIDASLNLGLAPPGPVVNREFEACLMHCERVAKRLLRHS